MAACCSGSLGVGVAVYQSLLKALQHHSGPHSMHLVMSSLDMNVYSLKLSSYYYCYHHVRYLSE